MPVTQCLLPARRLGSGSLAIGDTHGGVVTEIYQYHGQHLRFKMSQRVHV